MSGIFLNIRISFVFLEIFFFSYEPEIHPGATVRLPEKAVLKVFTTGSVTLTGKNKKKIIL